MMPSHNDLNLTTYSKHQINVRSNVRINSLIKDLEKVWLSEKIPDFYCYYFMMQLKGVSA